jgi:hypothetical protein
MSYPRKYAVATAAGDHLKDLDWDPIVDAANGMTIAGGITIQYPYSFIIRNVGGVYDAINDNGVFTYGGSSDAGGIDGADVNAVVTAALTACETAGGGTIYIVGTVATPTRITGIELQDFDGVNVTGIGEVYWTTPNAGVDLINVGINTQMNNIYCLHNTNYFGHIVHQDEQTSVWNRFYQEFPRDSPTYPIPRYSAILKPYVGVDGDLLQEGVGGIHNTIDLWFTDAPQITRFNDDTLLIQNWAGTVTKNLKLDILYVQYLTPYSGNLYINSSQTANAIVEFNSYNIGNTTTYPVVKMQNGNFIFPPRVTPVEPAEGSVYYDSGVNKLAVFNGVGWEWITSV